MDIILSDGMETRIVKSGPALYMLLSFIPYVGALILLIMTITRKQFKGVWLNQFIIGILFAIPLLAISIPLIISIDNGFSAIGLTILFLILVVVMLVVSIYILVTLVMHANKYSLQQYLKNGYEIVNFDALDLQAQSFVEESKFIEKPKYLFLDF